MSEDSNLLAFGARLREVRNSMNLSASKMAAYWGLERKTWERYELGAGMPKANVLIDLAGLGINEVWLLTGKGDMDAVDVNRADTTNARAAAVKPAAARVAVFNVAYLLAQESPYINLDPDDFALTFQELFDQLLEQEGEQAERVVSFAVRRLLRGGDRSS